MRKTKNIVAPDGKEYSCLCIRVFGTYVWIPVKQKKDFFRCCTLANRLCRYSDKTERQLRKIQELAAEISFFSGSVN